MGSELQTCQQLAAWWEQKSSKASFAHAAQVEISLQPWEAFRPDGVILFSDILTPLAGMGIDFDIVKGKGPIIADPIRSMEVRSPISRHYRVRHAVVLHDRSL